MCTSKGYCVVQHSSTISESSTSISLKLVVEKRTLVALVLSFMRFRCRHSQTVSLGQKSGGANGTACSSSDRIPGYFRMTSLCKFTSFHVLGEDRPANSMSVMKLATSRLQAISDLVLRTRSLIFEQRIDLRSRATACARIILRNLGFVKCCRKAPIYRRLIPLGSWRRKEIKILSQLFLLLRFLPLACIRPEMSKWFRKFFTVLGVVLSSIVLIGASN